MDLKILENMPPWEWPQGTDKMLLGILRDDQRDESDRLLAAELAGDFTVINDALADALLSIVLSGEESEDLRARAVISLGPALETAYMDEFEDPEDVPISEETFHRIQETLGELYMDTDVPKEVRRRILEGAVRAPQDWHQEAIRDAYSSDDESWRLTAVFGMRYIRGFNTQILEALENENEDIHYEAVCAVGNWEVDAAWSHIADLATTASTDKLLRLAAIEAVTSIRPHEAAEILIELTQSDDEDIVDAAYEAMAMAGWFPDEAYDDDDEDEKVFH
ncbi:MAG: HEAT repeat domain-containing protein [Pseudomonadota bacterium]